MIARDRRAKSDIVFEEMHCGKSSVLRAKEAGDIRLSKPFMPVNRCERIADSESMKMMLATITDPEQPV